jgi:beta-barrel assembly-enhancing protease
MTKISRRALEALLVAALLAVPGFALAQSQPPTQNQTQSQTSGQQQPAQQPSTQPSNQNPSSPQQPAQQPSTQPTDQNPSAQPGQQTPSQPTDQTQSTQQPPAQTNSNEPPPVPQQDTVNVKPKSQNDVSSIGNRNVGKGINFYSLEKEIALGKQLAQQVERSSKLIDDPVVTEYINRVGQNLVRNSDARVPFTIKVIDSDVVNAFALPGGFFYVDAGLILRAHSEAELAGVMGHEIAHVAARHGTKNATKGDIMQIASIPAMIFIPYTWAGYAAYEGMNLAIPLTFLKFSRDEERQADYLGIQYMYKAGYDPNAYISFFERIQADEKHHPGTVAKIFSDHPPTPDRIKRTEEEIARILPARDEYIVDTSEFDQVQARLRKIMFTNRAKENGVNKPTLRRGPQDKNKTTTQTTPPDDSDRPTLKRRPDAPEGP